MTLPNYNIIPVYLQYSVDFNMYVLKLIVSPLGLAEVYNKVAFVLSEEGGGLCLRMSMGYTQSP